MTQLLNSMERAHSYSPPMLPFANVNTRRPISIVIECIACSSYESRSLHLFMHEPNRHETPLHMLGSLCVWNLNYAFSVYEIEVVCPTRTLRSGRQCTPNTEWNFQLSMQTESERVGKVWVIYTRAKSIYEHVFEKQFIGAVGAEATIARNNVFSENVWKLILNKSGWFAFGRWNCWTKRW